MLHGGRLIHPVSLGIEKVPDIPAGAILRP